MKTKVKEFVGVFLVLVGCFLMGPGLLILLAGTSLLRPLLPAIVNALADHLVQGVMKRYAEVMAPVEEQRAASIERLAVSAERLAGLMDSGKFKVVQGGKH